VTCAADATHDARVCAHRRLVHASVGPQMEQPWCDCILRLGLAAKRPSRHVEIVESRARKHYPLIMEGHPLSLEQAPLAIALCERSVGADHAMPRGSARIGAAQHIARQARSAWRDVAVGTHVARGNRSHPSQDLCLDVIGSRSWHALDGRIAVEAVSKPHAAPQPNRRQSTRRSKGCVLVPSAPRPSPRARGERLRTWSRRGHRRARGR